MDILKAILGKHRDSRRHHSHQDYYNEQAWGRQHEGHRRTGHDDDPMRGAALQQLLHNKTLLMLLGLLALLAIGLMVILVGYLLPLLPRLFGFLEANGLKGVIDQSLPFLMKIWGGTGR